MIKEVGADRVKEYGCLTLVDGLFPENKVDEVGEDGINGAMLTVINREGGIQRLNSKV